MKAARESPRAADNEPLEGNPMSEQHLTRNVELLDRVMQHIDDHPEQHEQGLWIRQSECGTAACFAGWATILSPEFEQFTYRGSVLHRRLSDAEEFVTSEAGALALGLTEGEADLLFDANNSRATLKLMVKDLVNGDEIHAPSFYKNRPDWLRA